MFQSKEDLVNKFKRANAIRIKSFKDKIALIKSIEEKRVTSWQDQIKIGVKLNPIDENLHQSSKIITKNTESLMENNRQETEMTPTEALVRALERRQLVMQQSDDEDSELSSIDSQPYSETNTLCDEMLFLNHMTPDDARGLANCSSGNFGATLTLRQTIRL